MIKNTLAVAAAVAISSPTQADGLVRSGPASAAMCYAYGSSGPTVPCIQPDQSQTGMQVLRPTDDGSTLCVKVPTSAFCRILSDRDILSVRDFGATGDGSDQTAAIKAAQAAAGANVLRFPAGSYSYDSSVPYGSNIATAYEMIAPILPDSPYLSNVQNPTVASKAVRLWTVPWGDRFAHGFTLQGVNHQSNSTSPYERTGMIFRYEQRDPSTTGPGGIYRDLVGTDYQGVVNDDNKAGRIWGTSSTMTVENGSDGYVLVHEGGIVNKGTAQPLMSTPTSKVGVQMVADGTADSTAAFTAIGSGAKWFHGYYADATALSTNAFVLRNGAAGPDLAKISAKGEILAQRLTIGGGERIQGSDVAGRQTREVVLRATSTGGSTVRLTSDAAPAGADNIVNVNDYISANVAIRLIARNASLGSQEVAWTLPVGILRRAVGAASTDWVAGPSSILNFGQAADIKIDVSADKTNGGLNITFLPPAGTADQWSITATVTTTETQ